MRKSFEYIIARTTMTFQHPIPALRGVEFLTSSTKKKSHRPDTRLYIHNLPSYFDMLMGKELGIILLRRLLDDFERTLDSFQNGRPRVVRSILIKVR